MGSRTRFVPLALAAAALVATAGIGADAEAQKDDRARGNDPTPLFVGTYGRGTVRGIVLAAKQPERPRARLLVSLHGLGDTATHELVGSQKPCRRPEAVDGSDFLIWNPIIMANTEGDFIAAPSVRLQAPLRSMRSIRAYERESGAGLTQVACSRIYDYPGEYFLSTSR